MKANEGRALQEIPAESKYLQIMLDGAINAGHLSADEAKKRKELHGQSWLAFLLKPKVTGFQQLTQMAIS